MHRFHTASRKDAAMLIGAACRRRVGQKPLAFGRTDVSMSKTFHGWKPREESHSRWLTTTTATATTSSAEAPDFLKEQQQQQHLDDTRIENPPTRPSLHRLLSEPERAILLEQKRLVSRARELADQVGGSAAASTKDYFPWVQLHNNNNHDSSNLLIDDSTFSVVVAGEFNAGKSTFINALLGKKVLETGALPTTDCVTLVTHSQDDGTIPATTRQDSILDNNSTSMMMMHHTANVPLLQDLTLVDTPGTNAVLADHTSRTLKLLPTADLILFVTSADRPFPDSERRLLQSIQSFRKNIVIVINKMDILDTAGGNHGSDEKKRVVDFVTEHAADLLGARPVVIPVSAKDALLSKLMMDQQPGGSSLTIWERSNFPQLENFLKESLTLQTKIKYKLSNPIGQVEGIVSKCLDVLRQEQSDLAVDVTTIKTLQGQFRAWKQEMQYQMKDFQSEIKSMLQNEGQRCKLFFSRMRFFEFYSKALFQNPHRLQLDWDKTQTTTSANNRHLKEQLLELVQETSDSLATRGRAQGQAAIEFLGKRPALTNNSLVGSVSAASRFEDTRQKLLDQLTVAVHGILDDEEVTNPEQKLFQSVWRIAALSAGLNVMGVSTATYLLANQMTALSSSTTAIVLSANVATGMVFSTACLASGMLIYSRGKASLIQNYQDEWNVRSQRLDQILESTCAKQVNKIERRILDGVAPYTRYVTTEGERLERLVETSDDILSIAHTLRSRISKL